MKKILLILAIPLLMGASCSFLGIDKEEKLSTINPEIKKVEVTEENIAEVEDKKIVKIDSDKDGLIDEDEINIYKTDPNNSDTDEDTFLDGIEVNSGHDPLSMESEKETTKNNKQIATDIEDCGTISKDGSTASICFGRNLLFNDCKKSTVIDDKNNLEATWKYTIQGGDNENCNFRIELVGEEEIANADCIINANDIAPYMEEPDENIQTFIAFLPFGLSENDETMSCKGTLSEIDVSF